MSKKMVVIAGMALALSAGSLMAQDTTSTGKVQSSTVTCADLNWSALLPTGTLNEGSIVARGFTGNEIKSLHGFATDTLLDSMTSLLTQIGRQRAKLGAEQNGITALIRSNNTAAMNVAASKAQITDTDFAYETAELTRNQIIQQASSTILSQANQLPNIALSLLR